MSKLFFPAPEVAEVGRVLIERHHEHLLLHHVRVEFVFVSETPYKNGKSIWGTARKISSLSSFLKREGEVDWVRELTEEQLDAIEDEDARDTAKIEAVIARDEAQEKGNAPFFVITIAKPIWEMLNEEHRVALVDHELMHLGATWDRDGKTKLYVIPHDFEGFNEEIKRHGVWRGDAAHMAEAMKAAQLTFSFDGEDATPEKDALDVAVARLADLADITITHSPLLSVTTDDAPPSAPKKRGRPRKNPDAVATAPM